MSFSIQTNVNSLVAQENLRVNSNFQSQTIQRLTSGYRINSSADDAAGLAIANKFRSDITELSQGVRNANDGVSQLQIIDGGMNNIGKMLDRLKTLATQSASDSFTGDRKTLNSEYQTLVGEINRQAQSIGLNHGGTFAKSLSIYLGGGAGSTSSATLSNGTVGVDLSKATVDAQSLGLQGVQAVNSNAYDLGTSSVSSVQKIVNNVANGTTGTMQTQFKFYGAGFSNDDTNSYSGVTVTVNLNGVGDGNSLVTAINSAIQTAANQSTGQAANFKGASISASIVTDSSGNQKLAFTSSNSAFQVQATDRTSNAFLGNLDASSSVGSKMGTTVLARTTAAAIGAAWDLSGNNAVTMTVSGAGMSGAKTITLNTDYSSGYAALSNVATDIQSKLGITGVTVDDNGGGNALRFRSTAGAISVSFSGAAASMVTMGVDTTAAAAGTNATAGVAWGDMVSGGSYEMGSSSTGAATNFAFSAVTPAGESQGITVAANDATGNAHAKTISLAQGATGSSLTLAVQEINKQLQASNDSTLQQISAVAVNDAGNTKINFVSTLNNFAVSLSKVSDGTGMKDGSAAQGSTTQAVQVGTSTAGDISTAASAKTAVSSLTAAVKSLGSAQATVGKGQNQLNYAIGLAQSQITNFSSAQAQIRDADVASEAANLTKAQVLQQASIAAMAQANSAPQAVLSLLRG